MKKITDKYDAIIIGGGAAGLMAAGTAAERGLKVLLFDKNEKLGRKVRITGKGRCNVTNNCDAHAVISAAVCNGKFLYSAVNSFAPEDTMAFFEALGVQLKTERGNRVFPVSDKAADIAEALERYALNSGVTVIREPVKSINFADGAVCGVKTADGSYSADSVLIATGGSSYPATGSTGDGYRLAKSLGHTVTRIKPSLIGLLSDDTDCEAMQGLALKNCGIELWDSEKNKVIYTDFGEMLFTHFGVSGPVILSASAHIPDMERGRYSLRIDLKPALDREQLDARLLRDLEKNNNKNFSNSLSELLPSKMIDIVIRRSGIAPDMKCNSVTKAMRISLLNVLKEFSVNITGFRPIAEAIVTSGGVNVKEINPKTMESKIVKGLYFAGEVIDVDAYTGGFNLQIAFSTGRLAGNNM